MSRSFLILLLSFSCVAYGQIINGSLIRIGEKGDTIHTPIATMEIPLDDHRSIFVSAEDTIRPSLVAIIFASDDSTGDQEPKISNPYGSDIRFSKNSNSIFYNVVKKTHVTGIAELTWAKFENLCISSGVIRIETKRRIIVLTDFEKKKLSTFLFYFFGFDDDEQPPPDSVEHDVGPEVLQKTDPVYPERALREGMEGDVNVAVWIDRTGKVKKALLQNSSDKIFDECAIEAAKNWLFTPALKNGKPIPMWISIPFQFRLAGNR